MDKKPQKVSAPSVENPTKSPPRQGKERKSQNDSKEKVQSVKEKTVKPPDGVKAKTPKEKSDVVKVYYNPKRTAPLPAVRVQVTRLRDVYPKKEGHKNSARLIWLSDTHGDEKAFIEAMTPLITGGTNILFHCGDWTKLGKEEQQFSTWFQGLRGFRYKFVVSGNHESSPNYPKHPEIGSTHDQLRKALTVGGTFFLAYDTVVLQDVGDLTVSGLSAWNFVNDTAQDLAGKKQKPNIIQGKPNKCDVFISHYPVTGSRLGTKLNKQKLLEEAGNWRIDKARKVLKPTVHVFGHVHMKGKSGKEILERGTDGALSVNVARGVCWTDYYY